MSLARILTAGAGALALSACATTNPVMGGVSQSDLTTVSSETGTDGLDPIARAAFWGTRYDRDPADAHTAAQFSKALRAVDNNAEALRVAKQASARHPENPQLKLELGKALIANERAHEAVRPIEQAITGGLYEDWSAYSAYGVALDKTGRHQEARHQYDRALAIAPGKAQVLNNKGLSYALEGRAALAERTLRTAAAAPGGTARMRQNLALVLGLSGQTAEAERLARSDLPPRVAENNVAYFRNLVAQPAYWGGLSTANAELPVFEDEGPVEPTFEPAVLPAPTPKPEPENAVPAFEPEEREAEPGVSASREDGAQVVADAAPMALTPDGL
ncbi:tetratricopeptide repeat protein [Parvularcula oceani]|uniref:tetratricopeptide repeat protein n=1 Tax=Parvularcula oceani TaxID=1247963 RepID=UPI0006917632|nr:tetratricopeptide repeat protein [Parvularcula oceani]